MTMIRLLAQIKAKIMMAKLSHFIPNLLLMLNKKST